jgi:hypothetical protein
MPAGWGLARRLGSPVGCSWFSTGRSQCVATYRSSRRTAVHNIHRCRGPTDFPLVYRARLSTVRGVWPCRCHSFARSLGTQPLVIWVAHGHADGMRSRRRCPRTSRAQVCRRRLGCAGHNPRRDPNRLQIGQRQHVHSDAGHEARCVDRDTAGVLLIRCSERARVAVDRCGNRRVVAPAPGEWPASLSAGRTLLWFPSSCNRSFEAPSTAGTGKDLNSRPVG